MSVITRIIRVIHVYGDRLNNLVSAKKQDCLPAFAGMTPVLLFILALLPAPAHAAQISAEYLTHVCASDAKGKEVVEGGHITCQAYIAGVIDYNSLYRATGAASTAADFCIPSNVELGALQEIVYRYLRRNPQHQGFVAAPAVALALYEAFPCKARRRR